MDRRHRQSTYAHVSAGPKDYAGYVAAAPSSRRPWADLRTRIGLGRFEFWLWRTGFRISRLLALSYRRYHYLWRGR